MEEDDAAIMVAGTRRLVPFEQLSHADQVFLRDGLVKTTTPLQLAVRPQAVAPVMPPPSPVPPTQPEPTSTGTIELAPNTGNVSPPVTPAAPPSTSPPTYTPPTSTAPNYTYTPPEVKLPEPTYVPTAPPPYTPTSTSSSDGTSDTPTEEILGGIAALVSIVIGVLRWLNKED
jgi:hypothetical protein